MSIDKVPNSLEAEQNLIACILIDPDCLPVVRELVQPSDFFNDNTRLVFQACLAAQVVNQATVFWELDRLGHLERLGRDYLSNLIAGMVALEPESYAGIVKQCALGRRLIAGAGELSLLGYSPYVTPEQARELLERLLEGLAKPINHCYQGIRRDTT